MSRGLGRIQSAVIEHLRERGLWCWSKDLTYSLYERFAEPETERFDVSAAFDVSVRRAINSLAAKGLVCVGEHHDGRYRNRGEGYSRLVCWLPEHEAPAILEPLTGLQVEEIVLDSLKTVTPDEIEDAIHYGGKSAKSAEEVWSEVGSVPYSLVIKSTLKKLGFSHYEHDSARAYVAIHRAVKRLSQRRVIKAAWYRRGYYGWVKLISK